MADRSVYLEGHHITRNTQCTSQSIARSRRTGAVACHSTRPTAPHYSFVGLHTVFAVVQACCCSSLYSGSHNKMTLPSFSAQHNYLSLFRHSYMFRQLTTVIGSSIQYSELRSTAVQMRSVRGVSQVYCNCLYYLLLP